MCAVKVLALDDRHIFGITSEVSDGKKICTVSLAYNTCIHAYTYSMAHIGKDLSYRDSVGVCGPKRNEAMRPGIY